MNPWGSWMYSEPLPRRTLEISPEAGRQADRGLHLRRRGGAKIFWVEDHHRKYACQHEDGVHARLHAHLEHRSAFAARRVSHSLAFEEDDEAASILVALHGQHWRSAPPFRDLVVVPTPRR